MRQDGEVEYYRIQHRVSSGSEVWVDSNIENFLFKHLKFPDKQGEKGDRYRKLIAAGGASTVLFQTYGIAGFTELIDALNCITAIVEENPRHEFRIIRKKQVQETLPVYTGVFTGKE